MPAELSTSPSDFFKKQLSFNLEFQSGENLYHVFSRGDEAAPRICASLAVWMRGYRVWADFLGGIDREGRQAV